MIAGIIPGNRGAIVWLNTDGSICRAMSIPHNTTQAYDGPRYHMDAAAFGRLFLDWGADLVIVERAAPVASAATSYSIGFACGIVEGVLAALQFQRQSVSHQQWRSDLSVPGDYWGAVARVNDLTARHWPTYRFDKSIGGHRKQLAALVALYAIQCAERVAA